METEREKIYTARLLRTAVRVKMMGWLGYEMIHYNTEIAAELAELLQFKSAAESPMGIIKWDKYHAELVEKLKLLDGPHGYAIFKAMQAKQKETSCE